MVVCLKYFKGFPTCLILLLTFINFTLFAQEDKVSGIITYQNTPVADASVFIKGYSEQVTTSNQDGFFSLNVPQGNSNLTLVVEPAGAGFKKLYTISNQELSSIVLELPYLKNPYADDIEEMIAKEDKPQTDNKVEVKTEDEPITNTNPTDEIEEEEAVVAEVENENTLPEEEKTSFESLTEDIDILTKAIDEEQKEMIERQKVIVAEIDEVKTRLQNSDNLTGEQKNKLIEQLGSLNEKLAENSEQFYKLQQETEKKISQMREKLGEVKKESEFNLRLAFTFIGISLALVVVVIVVFLGIRKIKKLNSLLENKNKEIAYKNKQTQSSIKAAKAIQTSILPPQHTVDQSVGENFIIFRPKDVVSGDFYWVRHIHNYTFAAILDCTGHGVPGAFVSMIGYSLLNEIIIQQKMSNPSLILEQLHQYIFDRLQQETGESNHGMDVCLVRIEDIDKDSKKVIFAGAKRPLFIFEKGELKEIKGTRRGIGGIQQNPDIFNNIEFTLSKGTMMYLTSDGFVDTPNAKRKSFGTKRLIKLLKEIAEYPIEQQQVILENRLDEYREGQQQRDDVTFMAIKI